MTDASLHPVLRAATEGELPPWASASDERRAHMARVADLLSDWAEALDLPEADRLRWRAAGWLHDAARGVDPGELIEWVSGPLASLPGPLLHGPAAAERLRDVADPSLLDAIRFHTIGHPELDTLGRALYLADFLEPGRSFEPEWRASLRARIPTEFEEVLREVVAARICRLTGKHKPIRPETSAFWNSLVEEG